MDIQTLEYMQKRVEKGKDLSKLIATIKEHIEVLRQNYPLSSRTMRIEFHDGQEARFASNAFGSLYRMYDRLAPVLLAEYEKELVEVEKKFAEL